MTRFQALILHNPPTGDQRRIGIHHQPNSFSLIHSGKCYKWHSVEIDN